MPPEPKPDVPTAIDIFSGGGGLTVGLKRAGFHVVAAVENEAHAFATYKANHSEVQGFKQDVRTVDGDSLKRCSPTGRVDLIAGCPPCQGFSTLTSKYRTPDPRNELVREMGRLVDEVRPRAVMMENVPGLVAKGSSLFIEFVTKLERLGYKPVWDILQVADFGIPQRRRRLVLLAGYDFSIDLPVPTHSRTGEAGLQPWRTLRDAIGEVGPPLVLSDAVARGGPGRVGWHVVRQLSPQNVQRMKSAKPGESWATIPNEVRPKCHQNIEGHYFSNVYGRMRWDEASVTITSGCTTFSKGRFGHPDEDRTISALEAALIQTFPRDYVFDTPYMEYVCNIIGNALPCDFAEVVARQCLDAFRARSVQIECHDFHHRK